MLKVPRDRLPDDAHDRHQVLRAYFCDKDARAMLEAEEWLLDLTWFADDGRHVDPLIAQGLAWWDHSVEQEQMVLANRREGRVLSALYDTWTLHSWSEWGQRSPGRRDEVLILHIDDHRDLASPRLFLEGHLLVDPLTGERFDFFDSRTVESSILSGAVGMGSFLTPVLHALPKAEVRHLCQPPKCTETKYFRVVPTWQHDTLIAPERKRPAIELETVHGIAGASSYRFTSSIEAWLGDLVKTDTRPVLLHVDMDYFNNRYDGNSDWESSPSPLNPSLDLVLERIDEVCSALRSAGLMGRIEDAVVAYSPGFFPAEHWQPASHRLRRGLGDLYATSDAHTQASSPHTPDTQT